MKIDTLSHTIIPCIFVYMERNQNLFQSSNAARWAAAEDAEVDRRGEGVVERVGRAGDDGLLEDAHPVVHLHLAGVQRLRAAVDAVARHVHPHHRAGALGAERHLVLRLAAEEEPRLLHREGDVGRPAAPLGLAAGQVAAKESDEEEHATTCGFGHDQDRPRCFFCQSFFFLSLLLMCQEKPHGSSVQIYRPGNYVQCYFGIMDYI